MEQGDPSSPEEILSVDQNKVRMMLSAPIDHDLQARGGVEDGQDVALATLHVAQKYADQAQPVSYVSNPRQVSKFLKLFRLPLEYKDGHRVPYCASGISFAACQAYCDLIDDRYGNDPVPVFRKVIPIVDTYFKPNPLCREMVSDAMARHIWQPQNSHSQKPKPGWLVFYNWHGGKVAQHVGIVESSTARSLHTVEFNTSGRGYHSGVVARRERSYKSVIGFIKTYP